MTAATIRILSAGDAGGFRRIRLEALELHPEAFGASYAENLPRDEAWFAAMLADSTVFAAEEDGRLVGTAAFSRLPGEKSRHKAVMWAVYVDQGHRGRHLGGRLVQAVIDHARHQVRVLQCAVSVENSAARDLYLRLGFTRYGTERRALCVDGRFLDEDLLDIMFDDGDIAKGHP
ncbi:GNAT family N-acetyltransferase [Roseomonas marmotae]|uniref:GNAT family N-acetyltransferase n=1 Tax=Roseomonas marmotae TaxID=2768161 RepID=A0ABS3KC87_9PROT|nr:GNAT family N-acetyltransferase [Roseomonas marmotae]MBO1073956.1 GNAT family N-acetyltransferase [Roseomonas marmotae]QTI78750.1 GNAT family N-acetyltransferase [Roseomonas marmotae]